MKPPWDQDEYTTPDDIGVRVIVLVRLAAAAGGMVLLIVGASLHEFRLVAAGALLLVLSGLPGPQRRKGGGETEPQSQVDEAIAGTRTEVRIGELVQLLQRWQQLEHERGTPRFDPWEVQAVRHDIRELVDADPALERLFGRTRQAG